MRKAIVFILFFILIGVFSACGVQDVAMERDENLARLGKVWGFAKYTHHAFISGGRCWDTELLELIPVIYHASAADVNGILYTWFAGLGEDGWEFAFWYDFSLTDFLAQWRESMAQWEVYADEIVDDPELREIIEAFRELYALFADAQAQGRDPDWALAMERFPQFAGIIPRFNPAMMAMDMRPVADLSWINEEYLGALAARLQRFNGVAAFNRSAGPVYFDAMGVPQFSNQQAYFDMDYGDKGYRLLGLFRLWNAMKYFYPHLGILDVVWNDLLVEYIPKMLAGTDRLSYEQILLMLSHHNRDSAHTVLMGTTFLREHFGRYLVPVQLIAAEGQLVVNNTVGRDNPLQRGDVILTINGRDMHEIAAEVLRYIPYPDEEKALAFLASPWAGGALTQGWQHTPLRSHTRDIALRVLRDGVALTLAVTGMVSHSPFPVAELQSHLILENNIGLINPSLYPEGGIRRIMDEFADTRGMIIDLRQRPVYSFGFFSELMLYLPEAPTLFARFSSAVPARPGWRMDEPYYRLAVQSAYAFSYDRPVVLLMDERTISYPETVIMYLRTNPNVTVIGQPSMGSNGNITGLPLPGGINMRFTALGFYTPEGGQTHRVGLTPDIRANYTIQGIAEGRDEIMEAAVAFILAG
ncbi:MAG: S41 family peptidase [Defluviitaleaceae bacterium]|nr:S41 family peptidase [Defluviitaleaceae bacterium]MCL2239196.1 S41 family peptidase [Defluviitaleaceae bacterium]